MSVALLKCCGSFGEESRIVAVSRPDIKWMPKPFVFEKSSEVRYIDFENGDDDNPGTKRRPWKHHPWDKNAEGHAAAYKGICTYCFKKGVVYRGTLVARESGRPGTPIRLTVDPSWGAGKAGLYGSVRITGGWKRCTDAECAEIPASGRSKTWYLDLDRSFVPRMLWEVRGDEVTPIPIARAPDWRITNPDDPRGEWWEFSDTVVELELVVSNTRGFSVGDIVTGIGRWERIDELPGGSRYPRNLVTRVEGNCIEIDCRDYRETARTTFWHLYDVGAALAKEFRRGGKITNGRVTTTIRKVKRKTTYRHIDEYHLTQPDRSYWLGATLWCEGGRMPKPEPAAVLAYDPREHSVSVSRRGVHGPHRGSRYYLENLPQLLDSPGEYYYEEKGGHAGRLFLRLPDDRNPNEAVIEAANALVLLDIENRSNIEISGLDMRFLDTTPCHGPRKTIWPWMFNAAVRIRGDCRNIKIHNCGFSHVTYCVAAFPENKNDVLDHMEISDNDMYDVSGGALCLTNGRSPAHLAELQARLPHVRVLRNRIRNVGHRNSAGGGVGKNAVDIIGVELAEIAYNVIDRTWGAGLRVFNASDYLRGRLEFPLIRCLIHHNKVTNTLLGLQDYGGIASWMGGPAYIYCNISGNPVGYKHAQFRRAARLRKGWYRTSCYGVGVYLDGQYKGYVFNNIIWGKNNNVDDRIYNSCAFNEAMGFLNTVFGNTIYCFGVGLHKGMIQHNRCYYLGNLMLDIGHCFVQQEPLPSVIDYHSLAYAKNVFSGNPPVFGMLGRDAYRTLRDWRDAMRRKKVLAADTGVSAPGRQVVDAEAHDFRLRPGSAAIDRGAKVFVPWALYAVVGEWPFFKHEADPTLIPGENVNWNDEWYHRSMYQYIPRNDLIGHGIDASNFKFGILENWIEGALELNGRDEYCVLPDSLLRESYEWSIPRLPWWLKGRTHGRYDGRKRVSVDMSTNNFLIEVVLKTKPGSSRGGIVCKCARKGYVLEISEDGGAEMSLHFGARSCSRVSAVSIDDGKWHHLVAEIDRKRPRGINLYVDGKLSNGRWSGRMDSTTSLSNRADFVVGKTQVGAAGRTERYFAGLLDFLRISRGTLEDAETTIDELYEWEFDGPFLKDFYGRRPTGRGRDAGAVEFVGGRAD